MAFFEHLNHLESVIEGQDCKAYSKQGKLVMW